MNEELNKELSRDILGLCLTGVAWLTVSPLLALPLTAYVIKSCDANKKRRNEEKKQSWEESEKLANEVANPRVDPRPQGTPDEIIPYKGCIVEVFRRPKLVFRVLNSEGRDMGQNFDNIADVIGDIEENAPEPKVLEKRTVNNIRLVR